MTKSKNKTQQAENEVVKACDPNHYKGLKVAGEPVEIIDVLEGFMEQEARLTAKQRFDIVQALRYIFRAGRKGEALVDLQKAENYLHRAIFGEWIDPSYMVKK